MKKYTIIDFLRGYSIFTIALMHLVMGSLSGMLSKATAFGGAGVHVFILCFGFGLYLSYLKKPLSYSDFLKRRLLAGAVGGMGLSALMAWNGGILKLYNDIPSLAGYLSVALLIYKAGVKVVNRLFEWTSGFSYELYLVHSLVFVVVAYLLAAILPVPVLLAVKFVAAYAVAYGYKRILGKLRLSK